MSRKKVCSLYNNITKHFATPLICLDDDMAVKYYAVEMALQIQEPLRPDYDFVVIGEFDDTLGIVFNFDDAMQAYNVGICHDDNDAGALDKTVPYELKRDFAKYDEIEES